MGLVMVFFISLLSTPLLNGANSNLPLIYISTDKLVNENTDIEMLNKIKNAIGSSANVVIDEKSPNPGEAPRAIQNTPRGIAAFIAAADPGSLNEIVYGVNKGYLKDDAQKLDGIVFINYGNVDLENTSYLPRAYDDDYSTPYFAGLYQPGAFLNSSGIILIQPKVGTNSEEEEINKIARELVNAANNKSTLNTNYNTGLIAIHQINPEKVAYGSQNVLNDKDPDMGYAKWMYLVSTYVSGYPIKNSDENFRGSSTPGNSTYFGVLTIEEYREVGKAVSQYMEANKTVPESIVANGKTLKKNDMEYIFAKLTYDNIGSDNMTFPKYIFVNRSIEPFDIIIKYIKSSFYQMLD